MKVFGAFLSAILMVLPAAGLADEKKHGIRVTGECERLVDPDRVFLNFVLEELKDEVADSTEAANKRHNKLLAEIANMNLKDVRLSTSLYSTAPHEVWENKKHVFKGYKTKIGLRVETSELKRAGEVLQVAGRMGQENIQGPNPFVSRAKRAKVHSECLKTAAEDANEKAATVAKALNVNLGKAFDAVELTQARSPAPQSYMSMAKSSSRGGEAANIEYGKETISLSLEVTYSVD